MESKSKEFQKALSTYQSKKRTLVILLILQLKFSIYLSKSATFLPTILYHSFLS